MDTIKDDEKKQGKLIFLLISFQMIFLVILSGVIFWKHPDQQDTQDKFQWGVLLTLIVSQYYYAWHAIYKANVLELFAFLLMNCLGTTACTVRFANMITSSFDQKEYLLVVIEAIYIIVSILLTFISLFVSKQFYDNFHYKIYIKVGASLENQNNFRYFAYFLGLMKLYAQLSLITFVAFYLFIDITGVWFNVIDAIMIVLILVSFFMGYTGVKNQKMGLVGGYFTIITLVSLYTLVRMILIYIQITNDKTYNIRSSTEAIIGITVCGNVVVVFFSFYFGIKCYKNNLVNADYQKFDH